MYTYKVNIVSEVCIRVHTDVDNISAVHPRVGNLGLGGE